MMLRKLKIIRQGDFYKGTDKPTITLRGKWLEDAGFDKGYVSVQVSKGAIRVVKIDKNTDVLLARQ